MTNNQPIERTVEKYRRQFLELLPKCGGPERLAIRLGDINPYFLTLAGYNDVKNAKREKAGEAAMFRIVVAMEVLSKSTQIETPSSRLESSFKKMGIVEAYQPKYEATKRLKDKFEKPKP